MDITTVPINIQQSTVTAQYTTNNTNTPKPIQPFIINQISQIPKYKIFNAFTELVNNISGCMNAWKYDNCTVNKISCHNRKLISLTTAFLQCIFGGNTGGLLSYCLTPPTTAIFELHIYACKRIMLSCGSLQKHIYLMTFYV